MDSAMMNPASELLIEGLENQHTVFPRMSADFRLALIAKIRSFSDTQNHEVKA